MNVSATLKTPVRRRRISLAELPESVDHGAGGGKPMADMDVPRNITFLLFLSDCKIHRFMPLTSKETVVATKTHHLL